MSEFPDAHQPSAETVEQVKYYMTVGRLREALADYPDSTPLVVQSDAEGNDFRPLYSTSWGWWNPDWRELVDTDGEDDEPWVPDGSILPVLFLEPS